jgi:hypothetical protein
MTIYDLVVFYIPVTRMGERVGGKEMMLRQRHTAHFKAMWLSANLQYLKVLFIAALGGWGGDATSIH